MTLVTSMQNTLTSHCLQIRYSLILKSSLKLQREGGITVINVCEESQDIL
jgi:hypothetical protein